MIARSAALIVLLALAHVVPICAAVGHFVGRVVVEWVSQDGPDRDMRLMEDFAFVDPAGKTWSAPTGALIDGASIPRVLWTAAGSPFTGDYRRASVIHDYYCDIKTEPWQAVHRVFYDGMLADGVPELQAKTFYAAVWAGGPRWETRRTVGPSGEVIETRTTTTRELLQAELEELRQWVERSNPSLAAIEARADVVRAAPR